MVVVAQGDIFWADLATPLGSEAGFRRPVIVVQGDALNRSRIGTIVCIPLTGNLHRAGAPGNVLVRAVSSGLPKDSVAIVSLVVALNRSQLLDRAGHISDEELELLFSGIDVVLGR